MRCKEIIGILEELAPVEYACEWDNPGLLAGRSEKEVKKIYIALDATDEAVDDAVSLGADMLLTHHPLLFRPVKKINDEDFITRRIVKLIQADISYYAMHTNFDIAPGCMADLAAKRLGLEGEPLEATGEADGRPVGIGKAGQLKEEPASGCGGSEMTVESVAGLVKERFGLPYVTVYGADAPKGPIRRIAVSPGSGKSEIAHAIRAGVQVLVTGDIGHHEGLDAAANGMAVIDAGHYGLEHIFIPFMADYLRSRTGGIEIVEEPIRHPASVM